MTNPPSSSELLPPGTRLAHYEIADLVGAGGMGLVYVARDTKLGRDVALKVLPDHVAADADRRARFEREARLVAAVNHPNIVTIHSVEEADRRLFLTMELVKGRPLSDLIRPGGMTLDALLGLAVPVANAVAAAHAQGITHRDLKPANVMIGNDGVVKVLDFGLAKQHDALAATDLTTTAGLTEDGRILGTVSYMSPEQAQGKVVDTRSDVFSLGTMLFEIATGTRPFTGETAVETLSAILRDTPPLVSTINPAIPKELARVIHRALAKDPDRRLQTAKDLRNELEDIRQELQSGASTVSSHAASGASAHAPRGWNRRWVLIAGLALVVAAGAGFPWLGRGSVPEPVTSPSRWTITLPPTQSSVLSSALSPDGRRLVYAADDSGRRMLFVRSFEQVEAVPLRGTDGAFRPFFSPDGQWVGFFVAGQLLKAAATGGTPVKLCDAPLSEGADWGVDDRIVFGSAQGLQSVSAAGGEAQIVIAAEGAAFLGSPQILPGGRHVLFIARGKDPTDERIVVQPLGGGERRVLVERGSYARYAAGHLLYSSGGTLLAQAFDIERLELTGPSMLVADDLYPGPARFVVGGDDVLIYLARSDQLQQSRLVWVDRRGTIAPLSLPSGLLRGPRLSPDGRSMLVEMMAIDASGQAIWTAALDRATSFRRLTLEPAYAAEWTPDGTSVTFSSRPLSNLFRQTVDGSRSAERLTTSDVHHWPGSWTRDGQLVFIHVDPTTASDIWVLSRDGRRTPVLQKPGTQWGARLSPDGRWLAYGSDESGAWEVYVVSFPTPSGQWRISTDGGQEVLWSKDGREIFYRKGARMMSVSVQPSETFQYSAPTEVFSNTSLMFDPGSPGWPNYDVARDGRFLMLQRHGEPKLEFSVTLNWTRALERRAAAGQ